jgi:hypothetical protein
VIDPTSGELSNLDHYKPFFRELDIEVSKLISNEKVCIYSSSIQCQATSFYHLKIEQVTLAPSSSDESSGLGPPELLFLLKDLESKIHRSLVESKTKKGFPGLLFLPERNYWTVAGGC